MLPRNEVRALETRSNHIEQYGARPDNYEITYIMHNQQPWAKGSDRPCLVTYNPAAPIDAAKIVMRHWFQHIVHDVRHVALLVHLFRLVQGRRRSWHCGAHTLINAQETCFVTGLATARQLGADYPFDDDGGAELVQLLRPHDVRRAAAAGVRGGGASAPPSSRAGVPAPYRGTVPRLPRRARPDRVERGALLPLGDRQRVAVLEVHPAPRIGPEIARETQRGLRRDPAPPAHDLADPRRRHPDRRRKRGGGETERLHEVVLEDFAGVDGVEAGHGGFGTHLLLASKFRLAALE